MLLVPGVVWLLAGRGIVITGSGSLVVSGYGFLKGGGGQRMGPFCVLLRAQNVFPLHGGVRAIAHSRDTL